MTKREREGRYDQHSILSILLRTLEAQNPTDPCRKNPDVGSHNKSAAPGVTGGRAHDQYRCDSRQGDSGAGGRISLTVASATESGVKGAAPGVRPFNLKMYAMAAA